MNCDAARFLAIYGEVHNIDFQANAQALAATDTGAATVAAAATNTATAAAAPTTTTAESLVLGGYVNVQSSQNSVVDVTMRHVPLSPGPDLEDDDDDDAAAAPAPAAAAGTVVVGNNQTIAAAAPLAWPIYYRTTIPMNQLIQNVHRALDSIFVSSWAQFLIQTNKNSLTIKLKKFGTAALAGTATADTADAMLTEPAADPKLLRDLIRSHTAAETKSINQKLQKVVDTLSTLQKNTSTRDSGRSPPPQKNNRRRNNRNNNNNRNKQRSNSSRRNSSRSPTRRRNNRRSQRAPAAGAADNDSDADNSNASTSRNSRRNGRNSTRSRTNSRRQSSQRGSS